MSLSVQAAIIKIPLTWWLKQQASISHSSGEWRVQDQGASTAWCIDGIFSLCPHAAKWGLRELTGVSFIRAPIPFMKAPLS